MVSKKWKLLGRNHKFLCWELYGLVWTATFFICLRRSSSDSVSDANDAILHYIAQCLDKVKYECYVDIPGYKTPSDGTLPAQLQVLTSDRPDIVILNNKSKKVDILELTCPFEMNIDTAHLYKENKYAYFFN